MSLKTITEAVGFLVEDGSLLEKVGREIEQQDWQDTAIDALHLGLDLADRLVPGEYLSKPLNIPSGAGMANDLIERLTESLKESMHVSKGILTLEDVLAAVRRVVTHPDLLKDPPDKKATVV